MSSDHTSSGAESDQALLCWSEAPNSPSREEFVQVLESHLSEAIIKSTLKVNERTKVTLIGKDYTGIGIVRTCRREGKNFIMTIGMGEEDTRTTASARPDPSVLVIDEFITEEEEKIIDFKNGLENITPGKKAAELRAHLEHLIEEGHRNIKRWKEKLALAGEDWQKAEKQESVASVAQTGETAETGEDIA